MTTPTQTEPLQLSVSNFGPIAKANIDLRPLTVFVGPSNTGKSYLAILIYALHRFFDDYINRRYFGFGPMSPVLPKDAREQQPFDGDSIRRLADWLKDLFVQVESKKSPVQLPSFIESMVHSLLGNLSNFSEIIAQDIEWSFGIEDTARLIRHGNREGARITLRFTPFAYELALKRGKPKGSVISTSEEIPLYINPHFEDMAPVLFSIDVLTGANIAADRIIPKRAQVQFRPVAFCGGKFSKVETRRLSQRKIHFRSQSSNVQLLRCGDPLMKARRKER